MIGSYGLLYVWPGTDAKGETNCAARASGRRSRRPGTEKRLRSRRLAASIDGGFGLGRGAWDNKAT